MAARYTRSNNTAIEDGGVHENFNRLFAMWACDSIRFRRREEDLILTGPAFEMYNGNHETLDTASSIGSVGSSSNAR